MAKQKMNVHEFKELRKLYTQRLHRARSAVKCQSNKVSASHTKEFDELYDKLVYASTKYSDGENTCQVIQVTVKGIENPLYIRLDKIQQRNSYSGKTVTVSDTTDAFTTYDNSRNYGITVDAYLNKVCAEIDYLESRCIAAMPENRHAIYDEIIAAIEKLEDNPSLLAETLWQTSLAKRMSNTC